MICVTGGTGLVGAHLLFDLVKKGESVRAIKRPTSDISIVERVFSYYSNESTALFKKIEWVDHGHVRHQVHRHFEFACRFGEGEAGDEIAVGVLLPVNKVFGWLHLQRIG